MIKKVIFISLIILFSSFGLLKPFQLLFIDLLSPVIFFNKSAVLNLQNAVIFYQNIEKIRQENLELRRYSFYDENSSKIEKLESLNSREKDELRAVVKEDLLLGTNFTIAEVIFFNTETNTIFLKAEDGSFGVGDVVTYGRYLVGDVVSQKDGLLEARLISRQGELVSGVLINKNNEKIRVNVLAENSNQLVINNILSTEVVEIGDLVYTSTSNPLYISDLIIGTVERVEGISAQAFRKGYLGRPFDLQKLKYLVVVSKNK